MAKINIYFPTAELEQSFKQLAADMGFDSPSALCQYMATNQASITALLQDEYNGVDLQSITELIKHLRQYDTEQLYKLIANRPALDAMLKHSKA